jgi:hypothetical protein
LDLSQLRVLDDMPGGVTRVGGENDRGTTSNFFGDLVRVDTVFVVFGER